MMTMAAGVGSSSSSIDNAMQCVAYAVYAYIAIFRLRKAVLLPHNKT